MDSDTEIIWSSKARITFFGVLDYLDKNWTRKEMIQFNLKTQIIINAIRKNPGIFPASVKFKEVRRAIIDKNNSLFYKIDDHPQKIYLLTFFDNRQNPVKLNEQAD
jgi:hypothetical protein